MSRRDVEEPAPSRLRPGPSMMPMGRSPLHEPWEIVVCDDLTEQQHELTEKLVEVPRRSAGTIWFDSCGGSVYAGLALASLIRLRGLRATAVVAGECSSAALLPFAACEKRIVTAHSTLLFHPIRWTGEQDMRLEDAAEWARHFAELEGDLDRLLVRLFTGSDDASLAEKLKSWSRPGRFVSGKELVEAGLAKMVSLFDGDVWRQM